MTSQEFDRCCEELSVIAGLNQRYHQGAATRWQKWDRVAKIAVGGLAVAGLCLTAATYDPAQGMIAHASLAVAILGATAAIAMNVIPLGDWSSESRAMLQRYTDLREEVDRLRFDAKFLEEPAAYAVQQLRESQAKLHRFCGLEPAPNVQKLQACQDAEERSRGLVPNA